MEQNNNFLRRYLQSDSRFTNLSQIHNDGEARENLLSKLEDLRSEGEFEAIIESARRIVSPRSREISATESVIEKIFSTYLFLDQQLNQLESQPDHAEAEARTDILIDAQAAIVRLAAVTDAISANDILLKVALWRLEMPIPDATVECLPPSEAIASSALYDLIRMRDDAN